ncbi:MAG: DUF192 domain-containing protein [Deltaproteobacteria bacterium]|nr:DUF192 domain-containing protein [Deltaproteobacteria bacterium]
MIPLLLSLWACGPKVPTATIGVGPVSLTVEVADDEEERAIGLMHRDSMPEEHGMLFIYPDERVRNFWMKNTRIPLSIAFADAEGRIVRIADMRPLDTSTTSSLHPARYALEVNKGWFERHGVKKGDQLTELPPPQR